MVAMMFNLRCRDQAIADALLYTKGKLFLRCMGSAKMSKCLHLHIQISNGREKRRGLLWNWEPSLSQSRDHVAGAIQSATIQVLFRSCADSFTEPYHSSSSMTLTRCSRLLPYSLRLVLASLWGTGPIGHICLDFRRYEGAGVQSGQLSNMSAA